MKESIRVTITESAGLIQFKGDSKFSLLNSSKLNLNDSTLSHKNVVLQFSDTITISANSSGLKEDYFGYAFAYENTGMFSNIEELRDILLPEDISGKQYLFIIGKTIKSRQIVITLVEREVKSGKKLAISAKLSS